MISIICVTKGEWWSPEFLSKMRRDADELNAQLVILGDGERGFNQAKIYAHKAVQVETGGYVESVLNDAVDSADGEWILRLDDDEKMSKAMLDWFKAGWYKNGPQDIYSFPCAWLWGSPDRFISSPPFWTDIHPRFTTADKARGWDNEPHAGNPHGLGFTVPALHLHYKFLIKSFEERIKIAKRYEELKEGAGFGMHRPFTLPELSHHTITTLPVGEGYLENTLQSYKGEGEVENIGTDLEKRAFLVLGPESSGTKMLTRSIMLAGAYGQDTHVQKMDDLNFGDRPPLIVFRRSIPHASKTPNIKKIYDLISKAGYKVTPIFIRRNDSCTANSQIRNGYVNNIQDALINMEYADNVVLSAFGKIGVQVIRVKYEPFVTNPEIREKFFNILGLEEPVSMTYYNANEKYYNKAVEHVG